MSYLEDDLKAALRREEPPADFTERVLARLNQPPEPTWRERISVLMRPPRLQWVALSVIVSVLIPLAGVQYHKQKQYQVEGERAKQQLLFAVRVAGTRLQRAQRKVLDASRMDNRI
jgi:hypothetical protein